MQATESVHVTSAPNRSGFLESGKVFVTLVDNGKASTRYLPAQVSLWDATSLRKCLPFPEYITSDLDRAGAILATL